MSEFMGDEPLLPKKTAIETPNAVMLEMGGCLMIEKSTLRRNENVA
jgi:hypothetical protein